MPPELTRADGRPSDLNVVKAHDKINAAKTIEARLVVLEGLQLGMIQTVCDFGRKLGKPWITQVGMVGLIGVALWVGGLQEAVNKACNDAKEAKTLAVSMDARVWELNNDTRDRLAVLLAEIQALDGAETHRPSPAEIKRARVTLDRDAGRLSDSTSNKLRTGALDTLNH